MIKKDYALSSKSLAETNGSVPVNKRGWFRRLFAFIGPAYLVSVGYMDPGNWATDIAGGARFGYLLIWVLLMSNIMAVVLQTLSARLGIVTGLDLAQGCRREYPKKINFLLWILAEIAIAATDLAEVLGTIIGLNLLFGVPLLVGAVVTAFDTFLLLAIQRLGVRKMEAFIVLLVGTIGGCFLIEIFLSNPQWGDLAAGFIPRLEPGALFIAIGIIGATVMPHNLYLHSSLVQSRAISNTLTGKREACKFNLIDSAVALNAAFFVNAAILVMAAAVFHSRGIMVTEIQQAHELLAPILGSRIAPAAFAIALLAAGQSSTLTGTLSGQIVMEGFLNIRMRPWLRRLVTRGMALIPATIVIAISGSEGTYKLLILSQVILSLQLPFATIPLIHFTSDKKKMGMFVNRTWLKIVAWVIAAIIVVLNLKLAFEEISGWISGISVFIGIPVIIAIIGILGILGYIAFAPFFKETRAWESGVVVRGNRIAANVKPLKIKNIGVALEHSDGDARILSAALTMAKNESVRITLLHVVDSPGTMVYGEESASLHEKGDEKYLEELAREMENYGDHIAVETMIRFGKPAEEIIKTVEEGHFDMLIMGAHGHRGLQDMVHSKTVTAVRHQVKIPVMIVRIAPEEIDRAQQGPV